MMHLLGSDPMQYAARCDGCSARHGPVDATSREDAVKAFARLSWKIDERFKAAMCPKCAGPPSVFPTAHVTGDEGCSVCAAKVDRCTACNEAFVPNDVLSCRRARGHGHARCSTQRMRRFSPTEG
jgi:hypothetical protein